MRHIAATFLTVVLVCLPCFSAPKPAAPNGSSDAAIEAAIRAKLAKSKIGKDGFQVHVHHGVADWEGHTAVMQHKGAATRMAKSAGATAVENHIKIDGNAKVGQPLHRASVTP